MKVIDLLNKIANGEEVPNKIKVYDGEEEFSFEYNPFDTKYENEAGNDMFEIMANWKPVFNYTVEIIEEDNKIEKLDHLIGYDIRQFKDLREYVEVTTNDLFGKTNKIIDKINEIIDKINRMESK